MDIRVVAETEVGERLCDVAYGRVVRRVNGDGSYYLVGSLIDGTGRRALVALQTGNIRIPEEHTTRVIVVPATVLIGVAQ